MDHRHEADLASRHLAQNRRLSSSTTALKSRVPEGEPQVVVAFDSALSAVDDHAAIRPGREGQESMQA
jgi:hypothetical protein